MAGLCQESPKEEIIITRLGLDHLGSSAGGAEGLGDIRDRWPSLRDGNGD